MDEMTQPITKGEFRAEMAAFGKRLEERLEQKFDHKLEIWGGALNAKIEAVRAELGSLRTDMTRGFNVVIETLRAEIRATWEPVKDLPGRVAALESLPPRVTRLEDAVFGAKPKRRTRRRA